MDVDVNQERFLPLRPIETVASNVSVTFVALKMCGFFFCDSVRDRLPQDINC